MVEWRGDDPSDAMTVPAVVHLLGFPGTGKLTVATAMAEAGERRGRQVVVVDNHLTSLPILSVIGSDGTTNPPPRAWELVHGVRELVHRVAIELVEPDRTLVFTNFVVVSNPLGADTIDRVRRVATARSSTYLPVMLHCDTDELVRRVARPERHARRKLIDAERALEILGSETLVRPPELELEIDVTSTGPAEAATAILDHLDGG